MNLNDEIIAKTERFINILEHKTEKEQNLAHYHSVQNISGRIINFWGEKPSELKATLLEFHSEVAKRNYSINSKLESSQMHNKYLLPIEKFLIKKDQFVTNSDLHLLIIFGGASDFGLHFYLENYWYPIFILLFFLIGYHRRTQALKINRYSKMFW